MGESSDAIKTLNGILRARNDELITAEAEVARLREALEKSNCVLAHAFQRIHCLSRSSDTALATMICNRRADNAAALAKANKEDSDV